MPKKQKGQKRPAPVIGAAIRVARIATGVEEETRRSKPPRQRGHGAFEDVEGAFGGDVDYGQLVTLWPFDAPGRYSPGKCIGATKFRVEGKPGP